MTDNEPLFEQVLPDLSGQSLGLSRPLGQARRSLILSRQLKKQGRLEVERGGACSQCGCIGNKDKGTT